MILLLSWRFRFGPFTKRLCRWQGRWNLILPLPVILNLSLYALHGTGHKAQP